MSNFGRQKETCKTSEELWGHWILETFWWCGNPFSYCKFCSWNLPYVTFFAKFFPLGYKVQGVSKSCTRCDKVWYKVLVCQTRVIFWSKWGHNAWVQVGHSVSKWHHSEPICCHSGSKWGHCVSKWCQRPECLSGVITRAIVCQNRLIVGHGGSNWGHSGSNCCHSVPTYMGP